MTIAQSVAEFGWIEANSIKSSNDPRANPRNIRWIIPKSLTSTKKTTHTTLKSMITILMIMTLAAAGKDFSVICLIFD